MTVHKGQWVAERYSNAVNCLTYAKETNLQPLLYSSWPKLSINDQLTKVNSATSKVRKVRRRKYQALVEKNLWNK